MIVVTLLGAWLVGSAARAEVLDRLLAVVGNRPILDSDVRLVTGLRLVDPSPSSPKTDTLEALVDRALMLDEVDRLGPSEPGAAEVDARLEAIRTQLGTDAVSRVLEETGVPEAGLRGWLRDQVRLERYLEQRFNAVAQPTSDEVARYYADHPEEFTSGGTRRPLADVEDAIQQQLAAARRAELVADWQQALRRRARVRVLPALDTQPGPR